MKTAVVLLLTVAVTGIAADINFEAQVEDPNFKLEAQDEDPSFKSEAQDEDPSSRNEAQVESPQNREAAWWKPWDKKDKKVYDKGECDIAIQTPWGTLKEAACGTKCLTKGYKGGRCKNRSCRCY